MKSAVKYLLIFLSTIFIFIKCNKVEIENSSKVLLKNESLLLTGERFKDIVFSRSDIDSSMDIPYKSISDFAPGDTQKVALSLDFYEPRKSIDTYSLRPLIIWMHGGGFEGDDKRNERETCLRFAERGYTVASINYRVNKSLSPKRINGTITLRDLHLTLYRAIQDARFAIRFSKSKAIEQRVDSNNIFFAGLSAGGVTALHVAYLEDSEIAPNVISQSTKDSLGGFDYGGAFLNATAKVKGIMVFSGSILDLAVIKPEENNIPAILLHSGIDNMLPIVCGDSVYHLLDMCSGREVHKRLKNLGVRSAFKFYDSTGTPTRFVDGATHGGVVTPGSGIYLTDDGFQFALDSLSSFFNLN